MAQVNWRFSFSQLCQPGECIRCVGIGIAFNIGNLVAFCTQTLSRRVNVASLSTPGCGGAEMAHGMLPRYLDLGRLEVIQLLLFHDVVNPHIMSLLVFPLDGAS